MELIAEINKIDFELETEVTERRAKAPAAGSPLAGESQAPPKATEIFRFRGTPTSGFRSGIPADSLPGPASHSEIPAA